MTPKRTHLFAALLGLWALAGCETTSAALDGVGGVFIGAGQDIRRVGGN
jgi:hypothetical protein